MLIDARLLQPEKAFVPIDVTDSGIVTEVRPVQLTNIPSLRAVTDSGMVIEARLLQPEKASLPMDVTEFGIVIDARLLQKRKASLPMDVTDSGIETSPFLPAGHVIKVLISFE